MNRTIASALVVTLAAIAGNAFADDISVDNAPFVSNKSRAEVRAEAAQVAFKRSTEPAGSRVIARPSSGIDRVQIRARTVEAVRLGQINHGEQGGGI